MKKIKLLTPILAVTGLSASIAPLTMVTSCSKNYNKVTILEKTKVNRVVGTKASDILFYFKQENMKEAESTKVRFAKLVVNSAEVAAVDGLLKYRVDSAGNIAVDFNIATAKTQYSASKAEFDLEFYNDKANTSYTLTGFSVEYEQSGEESIDEDSWWDKYSTYYQNYSNAPTYSGMTCKDSFIRDTERSRSIVIDHTTIQYSGSSETNNSDKNAETTQPTHTFYDDKSKEIDIDEDIILIFFNFLSANMKPADMKSYLSQIVSFLDDESVSYSIENDILIYSFSGKEHESDVVGSFSINEYSYMCACTYKEAESYEVQCKADSFIVKQ